MTILSPLAFSPGSATLIFLPRKGPTVAETFALGAAVALADGVTATIRPASSHQAFFNGKEIDLPPVTSVLERIAPEPVEVFLETTLPLGCGFGVSAGCALSTTFALARRYDLDHERHDLGMIAHQAEVESGTGIGDVCTQLSGGIVYRRGEHGPFDVVKLALTAAPVHYRIFAPLSTKEVLASEHFQRTLSEEGQRGMQWLRENHADTTWEALLDRALEFAEKTELLTDRRVMASIRSTQALGEHATMVMLGQSVLATLIPDEEANWQTCAIDQQGTRWL